MRDAAAPGARDVFRLNVFALRGQPDLPEASWDIVREDGTAAGSVVRDGGAWPASETTYTLRDAEQAVLATVRPAPVPARERFVVAAPDRSPIGTFERVSGTFQPTRLRLNSADGVVLHLDGPGTQGVSTLSTAGGGTTSGALAGEVRPAPEQADSGPAGLLVRIPPELAGAARMLAVVTICCRDLIEREWRRTQGGRLFGT